MTNELQTINSGVQTELPFIFEYSFNGKKLKSVKVKDLYAKLGLADSQYKRWCKANIEKLFEQQDEYIILPEVENPSVSQKGGRPTKNYIVPMDIAKELAMLARTEEGKKIRRQFIEAEKKLTSIIQQAQKQVVIGEETSKFFNNLIESVSIFSPTAKITMAAAISERVYGIKVPYQALPPANTPRKMASELAQELGCSAIKVGKIVNTLGLRRFPYAEKRLSVAKNTNKEVPVCYYNEEAQEKIKQHFYNLTNQSL